MLRIGKVVNIFPNGTIKVEYEDTGNTSLPLHMLTFNNEFSMPKVGDMVVTQHMDNASSSGFVLGTYFGAGNGTVAATGYRKDYDQGAYAESENGQFKLKAQGIELAVDSNEIWIEGNKIIMNAADVVITTSAGTVSVNDLLTRLESLETEVSGYNSRIRGLEADIRRLEQEIDNL